ncbi:MAG TPA: sodium:proton antiporter [bacterium]|nr:sodium:proton antiporter [bacterium]
MVLPFVALLLCIAIIPLRASHWWESNFNKAKISLLLALPILVIYATGLDARILVTPTETTAEHAISEPAAETESPEPALESKPTPAAEGEEPSTEDAVPPGESEAHSNPSGHGEGGLEIHRGFIAILHSLHEYISFICMLGALFVISGGIHLRGSMAGSPVANCAILAVGSVLASFIGTTGASMILIRPLLKSILWRKRPFIPVIFFIFLVSNIGGLLTPLGDPPLFLGFLRGVPFLWTFGLIPEWFFMVGLVLATYFVIDSILYKKEAGNRPVERSSDQSNALGIEGTLNFVWLGCIVATTAFVAQSPYREIAYVVVTLIALKTTQPRIREQNAFTYHPIIEVAVLFLGIFITMVPALQLLQIHGPNMGITKPWQFFWVTGSLSSFLDNAPTYVTFFVLAQSLHAMVEPGATLIAQVPEHLLAAISCGAVFMGANSYIGNGPNFMVKAIAEEWKVQMPSFFGYMAWSAAILIPLFFIVMLIFMI